MGPSVNDLDAWDMDNELKIDLDELNEDEEMKDEEHSLPTIIGHE
jgi:hypothetical protein